MSGLHHFCVSDAEQYGVNASILLNNIEYWIKKNEANGKHFYEGRYWTYNSVRAFEELFPYFSTSQIRTSLNKLISSGVLISGEFNNKGYDRTKWFAINRKTICQNGKLHLSEMTNQFVRNDKPIPDNIQIINTDNTPLTPQGEWSGIFPKNYQRKSKTDQKRIKTLKTNSKMAYIGKWFGREESTLWNVYEAIALQDLDPPKEEVLIMESYLKTPNEYHRKNISTLLNNWHSELDKARSAEKPKTQKFKL